MLCHDSNHGLDRTEHNRSQGRTRRSLQFRGGADRGLLRGCGCRCRQNGFVRLPIFNRDSLQESGLMKVLDASTCARLPALLSRDVSLLNV